MNTRPRYQWPQGYRSAACFSVDVDAEAPYLWTNRADMPAYLGELEQRRFGPREGLWRLCDLLEAVGIRGSFFVPGITAERFPDMVPQLVDRGHEIGLHGWLHEIVAESDMDAFERALDRSIALLERQAGVRLSGFRSPAWEMTPGMISALKARGLHYDSSLMGYDHPYEIDGMIEVPVEWMTDDAVYFRFRGAGKEKWPPQPVDAVQRSWQSEWEAGRRYGALFMITVHPWISGRAQRVAMLEALLTRIGEAGDVWCATAGEIARWHASSPNAGVFAMDSDIPEGPF